MRETNEDLTQSTGDLGGTSPSRPSCEDYIWVSCTFKFRGGKRPERRCTVTIPPRKTRTRKVSGFSQIILEGRQETLKDIHREVPMNPPEGRTCSFGTVPWTHPRNSPTTLRPYPVGTDTGGSVGLVSGGILRLPTSVYTCFSTRPCLPSSPCGRRYYGDVLPFLATSLDLSGDSFHR